MGFSEYDDYDGMGLAELVRDGEVSAEALVDAAIERIESRNPALNAVVYPMYDEARKRARGELPQGPFSGVPFLLKDLHGEMVGHPSTSSTRLLSTWRPKKNAELVNRYLDSGVIVVGRTNTPEFGIYGVTESEMRGPARNPWNTGHTPGGSSGGSGAAVAARMVPMAHGGDGGGSIRIPAAHNALFGLKPTRARNPMGPFQGESWSGFVCEHVLTRSVRDSAAMLDATRGPDLGAPYQVLPPERPYLEEVGADPGKLRIAFTDKALFGDTTDPDCVAALRDAVSLAEELGHEVVEACPDYDQEALVRAYLITVSVGTACAVRATGEKMGVKPRFQDFEPATWMLKVVGDKIPASEYEWQRQTLQAAGRGIAGFFERYDVLLTPTAARPPVRIGEFALSRAERAQIEVLRRMPLGPLMELVLKELPKGPLAATPNTMLFNMTGQPAMSTPLYWNSAGLPIGTQWVGRFGDEATLFRLAAQLESARSWSSRKPALLV